MLVADPPHATESERERAMGELKRLTSLTHEARVAAFRKLPEIGPMAADVARAMASLTADAVIAMAQTLDLEAIGALAGKANLNVRCGIGLDGRRTEGVTWDGVEGRPWTARAI